MSALLAKSPRRGRRLSLHQHLVDTEQAACSLFRTGTRWADSYLRFFKVGQDAHDRFLRNLRVAALFHDIGKANSGFQAAMSAKQFLVQPFRHEHLSALVLAHREVIAWLGAAADLDLDVVTAAVLGHHLKAAESGKHAVLHPRSAGGVALHLAAPDVTRSLARIAEVLGIAPPCSRSPADTIHETMRGTPRGTTSWIVRRPSRPRSARTRAEGPCTWP